MIIGVDVGYTYTKFWSKDKQGIFRSTVKEGSIEISNSIVIEYEGKSYTIGEKGAFSIDMNKIEDTTFQMCLYSAILLAMRYEIEEINLVTGLPIGYYSSQKLLLRNSLSGKDVFIKYKGENKVFTINDCIVFPQSAGLFMLYPEQFRGDVLIIDIGGMTVDVSYFEETKLIKYATYNLGMLKLYGKVLQDVNSKYNLGLDDILETEKIIRNGLIIDEKIVNYECKHILKAHVDEILRHIKLEFPYRTSRKIFIGGGSLILREYLPSNEIKEEDIYANARAFYEIGVNKYDN